VIVATVALADLTPLDQFSMTLHMFTVGLIGLVVTPSWPVPWRPAGG
jgi:hypothetical protein